MKKYFLFLLVACAFLLSADIPSKYVSRTGHIHVESHSRFLDVVADNYQVYCELDPSAGKVKIQGLIKSFEFKLGAIDRAFNSDKVNLDQYSKFSYEGQITDLTVINFTKSGSYPVTVNGTLYIGKYKRITKATGSLIVESDGTVRTDTSFGIRIEEESMQTINKMMKEKLPSIISLDADKLGVSRDIQLELNVSFRPRA